MGGGERGFGCTAARIYMQAHTLKHVKAAFRTQCSVNLDLLCRRTELLLCFKQLSLKRHIYLRKITTSLMLVLLQLHFRF